MKLQQKFSTLALLSILTACAGSVETLEGGDGDGDGDGDTYGDGDVVPGDGDYYGDGDIVPGDGDYYGDGDIVPGDGDYYGDGDIVPGDGDYYGDGDVRPPPGVGGGPPIMPPPIGGSPGVIPIGPPIDPATCSPVYEYNDVYYCERQMECSGTWAYVWCDQWDGEGRCSCDRSGGYFSIQVEPDFIAGGAGCDRMMDACLGGGELAVVGEPECRTEYFEGDANFCGTNLYCETPVDFGGMPGSIESWSDAWCDNYGDEWVCECYSGNSSGRITFPEGQASPQVCVDAIGMCHGPLIDPNVDASCQPRSQWAERDYCDFELQCSQDRIINGQAVEVSAWQYGGCQLVSGNEWSCSCGGNQDTFPMTGAAAWDVCSAASAQCGL